MAHLPYFKTLGLGKFMCSFTPFHHVFLLPFVFYLQPLGRVYYRRVLGSWAKQGPSGEACRRAEKYSAKFVQFVLRNFSCMPSCKGGEYGARD